MANSKSDNKIVYLDINIKILLASVSPNLRATGRLPLRKNVKEKPAGAAAMALRE
jgi:hypothetical protein